jgi:hypothetical protein
MNANRPVILTFRNCKISFPFDSHVLGLAYARIERRDPFILLQEVGTAPESARLPLGSIGFAKVAEGERAPSLCRAQLNFFEVLNDRLRTHGHWRNRLCPIRKAIRKGLRSCRHKAKP